MARSKAGARRGAGEAPFIILTGLSGAGKSQAIRALEDLGYFCVDNLPTTLIPTLARLSQHSNELSRIAIVVDIREGGFLSEFPRVYGRLRGLRTLNPVLIFLEASTDALVRRFSESRRPHPLARGRSAREGIKEERERLRAIRKMADEIIDTSDLTVHELRQVFMTVSRGRTARARMVVTVLSFGFKHGVPTDADLVFDVRFLPNPYFVPGLRKRTGRDRGVIRFIERDLVARSFLERLNGFLHFLVPQYVREGKAYLTIAIGCTGGRHRSVMVAERMRRLLADIEGAQVRVKHRDLAKEG